MARPKIPPALTHTLRRLLAVAAAAAFVVVLMLYLTGVFHAKIPPTTPPDIRPTTVPAGDLVAARLISVPIVESAVGTVRPVTQAQVASKILARVVQVNVKAGQSVQAGDVLIQLDSADLSARLQQAEASLAAGVAQADQRKLEYDRLQKLLAAHAATQLEFDRASAAWRAAQASVTALREAVVEARTNLSYATIVAPSTGIIVDKQVDVGDMVSPGQTVVTMYGPTMQMVASVRESLTDRLSVGQMLEVAIDPLHLTCPGHVAEIVPESESASRSFLVKVTGPCHPGVKPGMFGRLLIPLGSERVLVVPAGTIQHVGQLDMVKVATADGVERRSLQLGRHLDDGKLVEVLSGLNPGDQVVREVARD